MTKQLRIATILITSVAGPGLLIAQNPNMHFAVSVYYSNSNSSDLSTVFGAATTEDNSYGCSHYNYQTYVELESPNSQWATGSSGGFVDNVSIAANNLLGPYTTEGHVTFTCSCIGGVGAGGGSVSYFLPYTPIQHNYPNNPLDKPCRITHFFDAYRAAGPHHADDLVYDNGNGSGNIPAYGTLVTAMESGTVTVALSGQPPAPYPACMNGNPRPPGDYVKIKGADGYSTIYFHMTPSVSAGQPVVAGQVIGRLDASGCQSAAHLHVGRKDPNDNPVNFTIPCVNPTPTTGFDDGTTEDSVPDSL